MRFQRYFIRQTIGLGGESETIDPGQNLLGGAMDANRLTFTVGKYSPPDIFDDNRYAHDGRNGFMNWSLLVAGFLFRQIARVGRESELRETRRYEGDFEIFCAMNLDFGVERTRGNPGAMRPS